MTPIDSLLAAKKAIAASEAAELAKDYYTATTQASEAINHLHGWIVACGTSGMQQRRDKGIADVTEVMAAQYRADNREGT